MDQKIFAIGGERNIPIPGRATCRCYRAATGSLLSNEALEQAGAGFKIGCQPEWWPSSQVSGSLLRLTPRLTTAATRQRDSDRDTRSTAIIITIMMMPGPRRPLSRTQLAHVQLHSRRGCATRGDSNWTVPPALCNFFFP